MLHSLHDQWDEIEVALSPSTTSRPDVWGALVPLDMCYIPAFRSSTVLRINRWSLTKRQNQALEDGAVPLVVQYRKEEHTFWPYWAWQQSNTNELFVIFLRVTDLGYLLIDMTRFHLYLQEMDARRIKINDFQQRFYVECIDRSPRMLERQSIVHEAHTFADLNSYNFAEPVVVKNWLDGKPVSALKPLARASVSSMEELHERSPGDALAIERIRGVLQGLWDDLRYRIYMFENPNAPGELCESIRQGVIRRWEKIERSIKIPPYMFGNPC